MKIQRATLCFLRRENQILLGMKRRGFGVGKWNGFGGKVQNHEDPRTAAIREVIEEIEIEPIETVDKGFINFHYENHNVHVWLYEITKWSRSPTESEEMSPKWFDISEIPYEHMWPDDIIWMPMYLSNTWIDAEFWFDNDFHIIKQIIH